MKKQGLSFLFAFLVFLSPAFATSIEPDTFSVFLYPSENATFGFNYTDAELLTVEYDQNITCFLSGSQFTKLVGGSGTDTVTIVVANDAYPKTYTCRVLAKKNVPDPVPSFSGGGSGFTSTPNARIPSDIARGLTEGRLIAIPTNLILKLPIVYEETKVENREVAAQHCGDEDGCPANATILKDLNNDNLIAPNEVWTTSNPNEIAYYERVVDGLTFKKPDLFWWALWQFYSRMFPSLFGFA